MIWNWLNQIKFIDKLNCRIVYYERGKFTFPSLIKHNFMSLIESPVIDNSFWLYMKFIYTIHDVINKITLKHVTIT